MRRDNEPHGGAHAEFGRLKSAARAIRTPLR